MCRADMDNSANPAHACEEKAAICGSLAHTSDTSCMIVDHADHGRTIRVHLLWKAAVI